MATALVIDDEPDIRSLLTLSLDRMGVDSVAGSDISQAKRLLDAQRFDVCLTDLRLPDGSGIELVRHIQQNFPDLPVAVITAYGSVETAVEALKEGAFDFISKPIRQNDLRSIVASATRDPEKEMPIEVQPASTTLTGNSDGVVGVRRLVDKVSRSQSPVHIRGETGAGKELVARMIHETSKRRGGSFVAINCGAIPQELMESEFFGHVKGSFTGALRDHAGLFADASGGTLFLDEIAELPKSMQVKLLRAIQEKKVKPVGSTREVATDVRLISATNQDLEGLVRDDKFRHDLYYRLNVIQIDVPPLRQRKEDLKTLIEEILNKLSRNSEKTGGYRIAPEAFKILQRYDFPGNVRELENILERGVTVADTDTIQSQDLNIESIFEDDTPNLKSETTSLDEELSEIERQRIINALEASGGNKTKAAKILGISFRSLRYKIEKLKI